MDITSRPFAIFSILVSLFLVSSAQICSNYTFPSYRVFSSCNDLPYLQAHLHWNYIPSTGKVEIAYRANQASKGWIAWAINPTGTGLVGSQALVAFRNTNGSATVYLMPITGYNPSMLQGALSFQVSNVSAEYSKNVMTILAVVEPPENVTIANHVWQYGSSALDSVPQIHLTSTENQKGH
ncbi:cytochrome b561 and DOMON domain-containing protein At5g47530-like [Actinidia eriantha]|uniref:cytochrome b561 and DOMON domain-containing protein At5g47530-like n=1 Tax=Actinidia eriantha TaxID=165200 RepID=UPI0025829DBF|nr:cytochrome b561 and DOMON domain-containing protein At5g47530-like [Actinidia eriantha]